MPQDLGNPRAGPEPPKQSKSSILIRKWGQRMPQVLGNPRAAGNGLPKTIKIINFNKKRFQGQVPQVLGNPRAAGPGPPKTIKIIDFNKKMESGAGVSGPREP